MEQCKDHSGICTNIENIKVTCAQHRGDFDKKLDKIDAKVSYLQNLIITTLIAVSIQLFFYAMNSIPKLLAACK